MKKTFRLRAFLVLLVVVAITPGIVVAIFSSALVHRDEALKARADLQTAAELVAATQERWVESVRQTLISVSSGPSIRRQDIRTLCTEFLTTIRSHSPSYTNIGVVDLKGNVQCQTLEDLGPVDLSSRRYFTEALTTGRFAIGNYRVGLLTGRKTLGFAMPVMNYAGETSGIAYATLDLEQVNRQIETIGLAASMDVVVLDANGAVVLTNDTRAVPIGQRLPEAALRDEIVKNPGARLIETDKQGDRWLHAHRPLSGTDGHALSVLVSMRERDVTAIANDHLKFQLGLMVAASLIGLTLAWILAQRSVARPILRLVERMQRVEQGHDGGSTTPSPSSADLALTEIIELDNRFTSVLTALETHQKQLVKAQQITRVGFYQLDLKTKLYAASPIVYEILGLDPSSGSITIPQYENLLHPDDVAKVKAHRDQLFQGGQSKHLQYRIIRPSGDLRWIDAFGYIERAPDDTAIMYSGAIQDITERINFEHAAGIKDQQYQLLFEHSLDGVIRSKSDGTILAANPAACAIFQQSEESLQKVGRLGVVALDDPRLAILLKERATTGRASGQLTMLRADGRRFEAELSSSQYVDASGDLVNSMVFRDITKRIQAEQHIHQLASVDALTDLPNRRALIERLGELIISAQKNDSLGAVLFIDLDHFKNVNDARGHATGDAMLRLVARRLSGLMRKDDTVARIGGDEFVVLLSDLSREFPVAAQQAMAVAEQLRDALTQPFEIESQLYASGGSIGVTLLPKDGQSVDDILREADTAMYRAKDAGRNRIVFFEAAMQLEAESKLALANDLALAMGTDQLEMLLQPQFDDMRRPTGGEMLMRWTHPRLGPISPNKFIPVAEESGLILSLGDWAFREGCLTYLRLEEAGRPMPISINVSPRQFHQADFVDRIKGILRDTGAPASGLILEVTEGLVIDHVDETIARMQQLVALGLRFSIDDFGTGYSSLSYLRRLPLYELKIDRSFVQDIPTDLDSTAIVQTILSMADHLGLHVVAEGVETEGQAAFLLKAGCTRLQGYLLGRPMPLRAWLKTEANHSVNEDSRQAVTMV